MESPIDSFGDTEFRLPDGLLDPNSFFAFLDPAPGFRPTIKAFRAGKLVGNRSEDDFFPLYGPILTRVKGLLNSAAARGDFAAYFEARNASLGVLESQWYDLVTKDKTVDFLVQPSFPSLQ